MIEIRFIKMHGIGNDYILIDGFEEAVADPAALARAMSGRHVGVGADGLILVLPPEEGVAAHVRMRMFNADGSEAEMCGNGIRCLCKYVLDHGLADARPLRVQTAAGVLALDYARGPDGRVGQVTVDMGEPVLDLAAIPVDAGELAWRSDNRGGFEIGDACWIGVFVSMGNPHVVLFRDEHAELMSGDVAAVDLAYWGPLIEHHRAFPQRMNAHWVKVMSRGGVVMRTWERGSGATLACGTGAAAVCVAGALTGRTERRLLVRLPAGDLRLRWDETTDHVFMTGPAVEVFSGVWTDPAGGGR